MVRSITHVCLGVVKERGQGPFPCRSPFLAAVGLGRVGGRQAGAPGRGQARPGQALALLGPPRYHRGGLFGGGTGSETFSAPPLASAL